MKRADIIVRLHAADLARENDDGSYDVLVRNLTKRDVDHILVDTAEHDFDIYLGGAKIYHGTADPEGEPVHMFPQRHVPLSLLQYHRYLFVIHDIKGMDLDFNITFYITCDEIREHPADYDIQVAWPWPMNNNKLRFIKGMAGMSRWPDITPMVEDEPPCPTHPGVYIRVMDTVDDYDSTWPLVALVQYECKGVLARFEFPAGRHSVQANCDALRLISEPCKVSGLADSYDTDTIQTGQYINCTNTRVLDNHDVFILESETPIVYDKIYLDTDDRKRLAKDVRRVMNVLA